MFIAVKMDHLDRSIRPVQMSVCNQRIDRISENIFVGRIKMFKKW